MMILKIKHFVFILVLLLVLPFVYSRVPFTSSATSTNGYDIEVLTNEYIKQNSEYGFKVHVFNRSNGVPITQNTFCYLHLYNLSNKHIVELNTGTVAHQFDYEFTVGGSNFSNIGEYRFVIGCNSSSLGGFFASSIFVTNDGLNNDNRMISTSILLSILFAVLLIIFTIMFVSTENVHLKIFFVLVLFLVLFSTFFTAGKFIELYDQTQTSLINIMYLFYQIFLYLFYFLLMLILIYYVWYMFDLLGRKGKEDRELE